MESSSWKRRRLTRWITAGILFAALPAAADAAAAAAVAQAAPLARPALKKTVALARGIVAIPQQAANLLCLPWGVVECVCSPLPGVEFMPGLRHIGQGLLAPFRFVDAVVSLPVKVVDAVEAVATALPDAAALRNGPR